jgi:hypothetical protein
MRTTNFPNGLTLTSSALSASDIENLFQLAIMQALGINPGTVTTGTLVADSNQLAVASIGLAAVGNPIIGSGIPAGTVITAITAGGGFGSGGFGNTPWNEPGTTVITMSNTASYANTYGAGGYGDMDYGSPSTWSTPVAIGSDAQAFYKVRVGWQRDGQPGWLVKEDVTTVTAVVVDDPYNRIRDVMSAPNNDTTVMETTNYTRAWEIHLSVYGPNSNDNARLIKSCTRLEWFRSIVAASNLYLVPNESDPVRAPESFNKQWWDRSDYRAKYYEAVQETITQQTVATAEVILEAAIGGYGSDGYGDNPYGDQTTVTVDITV